MKASPMPESYPAFAPFATLVAAAREWATHMDQWEKFRFETEFGTVYVRVALEDPYPETYDWVTPVPPSEK